MADRTASDATGEVFRVPLPNEFDFLARLVPYDLPTTVDRPIGIARPVEVPEPTIVDAAVSKIPSLIEVSFETADTTTPPPAMLGARADYNVSIVFAFLTRAAPTATPVEVPAADAAATAVFAGPLTGDAVGTVDATAAVPGTRV